MIDDDGRPRQVFGLDALDFSAVSGVNLRAFRTAEIDPEMHFIALEGLIEDRLIGGVPLDHRSVRDGELKHHFDDGGLIGVFGIGGIFAVRILAVIRVDGGLLSRIHGFFVLTDGVKREGERDRQETEAQDEIKRVFLHKRPKFVAFHI